jgi:hypothetical protein
MWTPDHRRTANRNGLRNNNPLVVGQIARITFQRAIPVPELKIVVHCALRR